ncbi:hypothetical protein MY10362_000584 [Beauveria mimosiformis]
MRTDVPPLTKANDWTRLDYRLHHKLFHRNPESATRKRSINLLLSSGARTLRPLSLMSSH